jgi:hypothetical protein
MANDSFVVVGHRLPEYATREAADADAKQKSAKTGNEYHLYRISKAPAGAPLDLQQSYRDAEDECDALRVCLAWAGRRLSQEDCRQLAKLLRDKKIVVDGREEDRELLLETERLCLRMATHLRAMIERAAAEKIADFQVKTPTGRGGSWFAVAEDLATRASEFEKRPLSATLHEARVTGEAIEAIDSGRFRDWMNSTPRAKDEVQS